MTLLGVRHASKRASASAIHVLSRQRAHDNKNPLKKRHALHQGILDVVSLAVDKAMLEKTDRQKGQAVLSFHNACAIAVVLLFVFARSTGVRVALTVLMCIVLLTQVIFGGCLITQLEERYMKAETVWALSLKLLGKKQNAEGARIAVVIESLIVIIAMVTVIYWSPPQTSTSLNKSKRITRSQSVS